MKTINEYDRPATMYDVLHHYIDANTRAIRGIRRGNIGIYMGIANSVINIVLIAMILKTLVL